MGAIVMPIFEYICQECQHEFEILVFGRNQAKCPKCHSQKLNPQLSVFAMSSKGMSAKGSAAPSAPRAPADPVAILGVRAHVRSVTSTSLALNPKNRLFSGHQTFGTGFACDSCSYASPSRPPTMP